MRSVSPTKTDQKQPLGRANNYHGVFVGIIKDNEDVQRMGRLRVWIPEFGSKPDDKDGWTLVSYCSPFAGATNPYTEGKNKEKFEDTQTSYGMWMVPPDIGNQVLIMFANGDPHRGFWIGCIYQQYMNNMVPGMPPSVDNYQYGPKYIPVAEYNKWDTQVTNPDTVKRPYQKTKFKGLGTQGLITDNVRGTSTTSARRETPSEVFGILTPGPVEEGSAGTTPTTQGEKSSPRRKGGSAFFMDDKDGEEKIVLTTKSGAKIQLDETNGFVYIVNRDGTTWISMDMDGNVDVFGARNISMRAQRDINIRADKNVNIEAGQNIFMKAAKDTTKESTTFTYDVNNTPETKTVDWFKWVGEGQGQGGNIVMQALNNWHMTARENGKVTVEKQNLDVKVKRQFYLTTEEGGQQYLSKQGIKMSTDAAYDVTSKSEYRVFTDASMHFIAKGNYIVCTEGKLSINADNNVDFKFNNNFNLKTTNTMAIGGTNVTVAASGSATYGGAATSITSQSALTLAGAGINMSTSGVAPPSVSASPSSPQGAIKSASAAQAEVKPKNDLINVLYDWKDADTKFIRNSENVKSTVSRMPTLEPSPVHKESNGKGITKDPATLTDYEKNSEGSSSTKQPVDNPDMTKDNTNAKSDTINDSNALPAFSDSQLRCELTKHEGRKTKTYLDTVGLLAGGVGHLLSPQESIKYPLGTEIPVDQIENWFDTDIRIHTKVAQNCIGEPTFSNLDDTRKRACINLAFNLGNRLYGFPAFIKAIQASDFETAGNELQNSLWYKQVGIRGPEVVQMVKTGKSPIKCKGV